VSSSNFTAHGIRTAAINGVSPCWSTLFGLAPAARRTFIIAVYPLRPQRAAAWRRRWQAISQHTLEKRACRNQIVQAVMANFSASGGVRRGNRRDLAEEQVHGVVGGDVERPHPWGITLRGLFGGIGAGVEQLPDMSQVAFQTATVRAAPGAAAGQSPRPG
jgi:hypothetical protein